MSERTFGPGVIVLGCNVCFISILYGSRGKKEEGRPGGGPAALHEEEHYLLMILISILRFCARPSSVSFGAIGFNFPNPRVEILSSLTPSETK